MIEEEEIQPQDPPAPIVKHQHPTNRIALKALFLLVVFISGLGSGYLIGRRSMSVETQSPSSQGDKENMGMIHQVNPEKGYLIPAVFGRIGPQILAAGAIDLEKFVQIYKQAGQPLTEEQMAILTRGTDANVVINRDNAYFLLNFFWALGLANSNTVLSEGPMMAEGKEQIGNFASTGGWTIGSKPVAELYASTPIISLTDEQQARLMEVATAVYRPCCDNPTHFPDCNHGMAMLGLLELMASQDASVEEMFAAAKYVNAFWYPQQMLEVATLLKATEAVEFAHADARQVVSRKYSSGTGFQTVHQWLVANGLLEQATSSGGGCAVQ